ncbi:MAG: glycosyltransferase [Gemmatimonadales bacterium]
MTQQRPPHVVHVVLKFDKGGLETTALNLSRELRRMNIRSSVLALDGGGETFELARSEGIECLPLSGRSMTSPGFHARVLGALRALRPTVVHTHHFSALLNTLPAGALAGPFRRTHTEHSRLYLADRADHRWLLRQASRRVPAFAVVGESMVDWYRNEVGISTSRLRVVVNGVDTGRFAPPSAEERAALRRQLGLPEGVLVGSVGRLASVKNYGLLIRAAAAARRVEPRVVLVLIGEGPEREALEAEARAAGLGDAVHFAGWQRDSAPWVRALDVFALSSLSEALPIALLEAMAAAVPVLGTEVGDVTGIVRASSAGLVTRPDDETGYHAALTQLVTSERRIDYGRAGRVAVERDYSIESMTRKYLDCYGIS